MTWESEAQKAAKAAERMLDKFGPDGHSYDPDAQLVVRDALAAADEARRAAELNRTEAAEAASRRQAANFANYDPDAPLDWTPRASVEPGSYFEQRRLRGWPNRGDEEFEELRLGQFLRACITGPTCELERRVLSEGTDATGGILTPSPLSARVFDLLRANLVVRRAGAEVVAMESDSLTFARLATDVVCTWRAESSTDSATDPTFDSVVLQPHTLRGIVRASRELVQDSAPTNIETVLERSFIEGMARQVDSACLTGVGSTGNQPLGLSNSTGITTIAVNQSLTFNSLVTPDAPLFVTRMLGPPISVQGRRALCYTGAIVLGRRNRDLVPTY